MKKKLSFLFALLLVSAMGWAIDWSEITWLGNGGVDTKYNDKVKAVVSPELPGGAGGFINNLQKKGTYDAIHIAMPSAAFGAISLDAADYTTDGAGFFPHLSAFTKQENVFTVVCNATTYTFTVYYEDGEPDDLTGWNIARGKTAYAGHVAENGIAAANDGNKGTRWGSNGASHYAAVGESAGDWWYVDLGGFYQVNQIKILFQTAAPTDYDLLISNNAVSWTVIGTYTDQPKIGNTDENYNVYNFTNQVGRYVKIFARQGYNNMAYGISMWEFEVYGDRASISDVNPPVMGTASLSGDPLYNQVNIAVAATDTEDGTVGQFHVVDASKGVDQVCTAAAGVIAVTGLTEQTTYNFTITALDAAGNESENNVIVVATTPIDPTMPTTAAPVPSGTGKEILPIYSDAFTSILEHDFSKNGFDNPATLYQEINISGNKILVYDLSVGPKFVIWGMWNDGDDAIIAQSAYRAEGKMGIDASEMEYMHVDIWSLQACNSIWVNVNDEGPGALRLSHNGEGWQGFDIALSDISVSGDENKRVNNVRWLKFRDFGSVTGKLAFDNAYFWKTSTGLRSVSATPNNAEYGSASVVVKSTGSAPEGGVVADGTEVTFSAAPNDGYVFVNWSNGETRATFDAVVNSSMKLTANFRALGNIYCNTLVHSSNGGQEHDAYVTMKRSGENEYQLIVRAEYALGNFSNTEFRIKALNAAELSNYNLNNKGVLSADNHTLTGTIISTIEPEMISGKLYVNIVGQWEGQFDRLTNIEYSQPCADPEITAIELNKTEATLDMGNTLTLVPTFTPAYMSADLTWQTSDAGVATVDNGVVTPVAAGNVTITAKVTDGIKATCSVTVQASTSHNWYGYGTSQDLDYTYRIEYTTDHHIVAHVKRQGNKTGLVDASMLISGAWTTINVTEGEDDGWKKGTTEATFIAGNNIHILIQSNFAGASSIIEFEYEVGSDNVMPTILPSVISLSNSSITMGLDDENVQLTAEIHHSDAANKSLTWTSGDESVATVINGLVTPVGVGSTVVRATTHNGISASCDVTVVGALETQTYWGNGVDNGVAIAYSITRNVDHTVTYIIETLHNKTGFGVQVNDGDYHNAVFNDGIYSWTSETTYIDGANINGFFYMPFAGGAARVDFSYTVGASSVEHVYIPVTFDQDAEDASWIETNNGEVRDVDIARTLTANSNYKTICFPFSMNAEQIAATFGECEILMLNGGRMKSEQDIYIQYVPVHEIEAGKPYLMTIANTVTGLDFDGVLINSSTANNEIAIDLGDGKAINMVGTFVKKSLTGIDQYYLDSDGYLHSVKLYGEENSAAVTIPAFRCYYEFEGFSNPAAVRARVVRATDVYTDAENVTHTSIATKQLHDGQLFIIRDGKRYTTTGLRVD